MIGKRRRKHRRIGATTAGTSRAALTAGAPRRRARFAGSMASKSRLYLEIAPLGLAMNLAQAGWPVQRQAHGVIPVDPQPLALLARPLGPAAKSAGPSAGFGLWTTGITVVRSTLVHHGTGDHQKPGESPSRGY